MADEKTLSPNVSKIVDEIKKLSLMEVSELVKSLEETFGVSAAPVMMAGAAAAAPAAAEEKDAYDVVLAAAGGNKIGVIKAVRELKPELGLAEAKAFVESAPKVLLEGVKKEVAKAAEEKLKAAGATVELK